MYRFALEDLNEWLTDSDRMPLVLHGARQVGKTWLIREFARINNLTIIEINFEKNHEIKKIFELTSSANEIILALSSKLEIDIDINKTLLFLDEIQAYPQMLAKLRWFKEDMQGLAVIATGSLLEFTLASHDFSMPVGRISYLHLEPISFEEFIYHKNKKVLEYLKNHEIKEAQPFMHDIALNLLQEYTLVGGMPAVINKWIETKSLYKIQQLQSDLLSTYEDDFNKYRKRYDTHYFNEVLSYIPQNIGNKMVYSHINDYSQSGALKEVVKLISMARVVHLVRATEANGVPLDDKIKHKHTKVIFLDVGLTNAKLGLKIEDFSNSNSISLVNKGAVAEQLAGQLLRTINYRYIEPKLYYWQNSNKNSNAEIDYIIQHNSHVIPVEVKAGTKGSMQALHNFMQQKGYKVAIRLDSNPPSIMQVNTTTSSKEKVSYTLLSLPLYMTGQIPRLLDKVFLDIANSPN